LSVFISVTVCVCVCVCVREIKTQASSYTHLNTKAVYDKITETIGWQTD